MAKNYGTLWALGPHALWYPMGSWSPRLMVAYMHLSPGLFVPCEDGLLMPMPLLSTTFSPTSLRPHHSSIPRTVEWLKFQMLSLSLVVPQGWSSPLPLAACSMHHAAAKVPPMSNRTACAVSCCGPSPRRNVLTPCVCPANVPSKPHPDSRLHCSCPFSEARTGEPFNNHIFLSFHKERPSGPAVSHQLPVEWLHFCSFSTDCR